METGLIMARNIVLRISKEILKDANLDRQRKDVLNLCVNDISDAIDTIIALIGDDLKGLAKRESIQ